MIGLSADPYSVVLCTYVSVHDCSHVFMHTGMRLAEVLAQVEELRSQTEGMRETLGDVHTELAGVKTQVG